MGNTACGPRMKVDITLTEKEIAELSALTGFTPKQVVECHRDFLEDVSTKNLNKKRFTDVYKQFYPSGKPEKFCEYLFPAFDNDNSDDIHFDEYLIMISATTQLKPKNKLEWAFSMCDIDRNGFIDKKEMKRIMEAMFDLVGEQRKGTNFLTIKVNQIFDKMDINGDGKLSRDEFINGCLQDNYLRRLVALLAPSNHESSDDDNAYHH